MIELINGNALYIPLADESVQCVVTSPPYFGLRRYDVKGEIGLEKSPAEYVEKLVAVFREVWRVLRPDGTLWLNLGDSYNGSGKARGNGGVGPKSGKQLTNRGAYFESEQSINHSGFKPKDLFGIPWRCAFALQAEGYYLRSEIIWSKPNPMPESVEDRPTRSHECVFLLSKQAHYFFDAEAIKEPSVDPESYEGMRPRNSGNMMESDADNYKFAGSVKNGSRKSGGQTYPTRNKRSVWEIPTQSYHGAHFASFPEKLVEPMILAGTSPQACENCGAPWKRKLERVPNPSKEYNVGEDLTGGAPNMGGNHQTSKGLHRNNGNAQGEPPITVGWQSTCSCPNNTGSGHCIVLDPFAGTATVGRVCIKHKRSFVGLELKPEYIELARERTSNAPVMLMEMA